MYLSARARLIMEQLLTSSRPVFINELAEDLSVSVRTIRRDLKEVEETLASYQLKLMKEHGILTLSGLDSDKQRFRWQLMDLSYNEYSPEERQRKILKELLKEEGLKLVGLANDLNVTISTISKDLTKIEERLPNTIRIERRRGLGVCLLANEVQKRSLMSELFAQQFPDYQLLNFFQEKSRDSATSDWVEGRLLDLVSEVVLKKVEYSVKRWRSSTFEAISDEAYANLIVHITISVERMIAGNFIQTYETRDEMMSYPEFPVAQKILADILEMEPEFVPKGESAYVTTHIRAVKTTESRSHFMENEELEVLLLVNKLIKTVEYELQQELPKELLTKGLIAHLRPTLRRLQQGMRIFNPLTNSIKQNYADLFKVVRQAFDQVYQEKPVPDEEIGYLVLHFGAVLLQLESENCFSGLVVCASGIGTSRMLVTRLRQRIPQLKKLETVSLFELGRKKAAGNYNVIISTIDLGQVDFDYFLVSPILTERELSQISIFLKSLHSGYHKKIAQEEQAVQLTLFEATHFLEQQQIFTSIGLALLKNFGYFKLNEKLGTMEDTIRVICTQLLEKVPSIDVEALVRTFLYDGNWKAFGIPETKIGMFHARNESIQEPIFQLFSLEQPISIETMDRTKMPIDRIVLLLVPEKFSQEGLEVISYISTLFVDSQQMIQHLENGVNEEVTSYFVQKLLAYIESRGK
ncbi:BglG family transcription antiterminator [Enterococcus ureasiticus]|uniref:BglG family transcription antiterminator n=1 Tax=Enterococcus ureasiticus TaxID=903984 RepID=UPI001A8FE270|nr:BglG family transcription antiterminator [Enterococcus ureasiticus]MBO0474023.1 BglG family transcription antiterminator [Enterococcus ureasiticus]